MARMAKENPAEFCERAVAVADRYRDRWRRKGTMPEPVSFEKALRLSGLRLEPSTTATVDDSGLAEIERKVAERADWLGDAGPFPHYENADITLARFCYLAVRATKPQVVLETGVAAGVSSAFVLQALSLNGWGNLWSIDLPPLAQDSNSHVGAVVPEELKGRWRLRIGTSRRILPQLIPELGRIDVFIHDSLHTYENMRAEFRTAWPFLKPGGMLIADDVESNSSFKDFVDAEGCPSWFAVQQEKKAACFGVAFKKGIWKPEPARDSKAGGV